MELATCQSENYLALEETSDISWSNSFIVQMGKLGLREEWDFLQLKQRAPLELRHTDSLIY